VLLERAELVVQNASTSASHDARSRNGSGRSR
jgi:hypothetical protein